MARSMKLKQKQRRLLTPLASETIDLSFHRLCMLPDIHEFQDLRHRVGWVLFSPHLHNSQGPSSTSLCSHSSLISMRLIFQAAPRHKKNRRSPADVEVHDTDSSLNSEFAG